MNNKLKEEEINRKLFTIAQKNKFQLSKPYIKMIYDTVKQDLQDARKNLKLATRSLKFAEQGKSAEAYASREREI